MQKLYWIIKINVSRDIPTCCALFIYSFVSQEKDKEKYQKSKKNLSLKTTVRCKLQETLALEHVSTQGTLACDLVL